MLRRLDSRATDFDAELAAVLSRQVRINHDVRDTVVQIVEDVRTNGDEALLRYTALFDDFVVADAAMLEISSSDREVALSELPSSLRQPLETAAVRIEEFHRHQKLSSWDYDDGQGSRLGQQVTPIEKVGIYVPGGKAAYPSSVLMSAIPAKIAGVKEIVMVAPSPNGVVNRIVLAASHLAGVDRVFSIGGAQAVAALGFGTATIPRVDKIVGPGNAYVTSAKQILFGEVGIDMVAGPSEVVIIADSGSNPEWLAMDLFAQAEHDENAQSILLSPDHDLLDKVICSMHDLLPKMNRKEIIESSLVKNGAMIQVGSLESAVDIANQIAPEHLQLMVRDPTLLLDKVRNAGAIFCGYSTAEVFGDYCAGPNHVLPTAGTARFASPLGVYDFQKRSSVIWCSTSGASFLQETASVLAECEGLLAHASSAMYRRTD
ncbi:MAG: histidinol dehydrogenase [Acidiferrobacteraceae bacterium]|nr:histidinol dehydrogenase [Acidiferrobacteraceae bacterium]